MIRNQTLLRAASAAHDKHKRESLPLRQGLSFVTLSRWVEKLYGAEDTALFELEEYIPEKLPDFGN